MIGSKLGGEIKGKSKMNETYIKFPCGSLMLEGALSYPEGDRLFAAVVVCHPHPLYGGSMDNNVVCAVCKALHLASIVTLRFNFRGVGGSDGSLAEGLGSIEDVKVAISYVSELENVDHDRIGLVGYSFGGAVALNTAPQDERVKAVAAVSPALTLTSFDPLKNYTKPKFLISGGRDNVISPIRFQSLAEEISEPKGCRVVPGADHFWIGHEAEVAKAVGSFFAEAIA